MSVVRSLHPKCFFIAFLLWPFSGSITYAQSCHVDAPRYKLREDTVTWSMTIAKGRNCIRGVRFSDVQFESIKLISAPQFGKVVLQGPGFTYSADERFQGEDFFSVALIGVIGGMRGSSVIRVIVSTSDNGASATTSPQSVTPSDAHDDSSRSATIALSGDINPPSVSFTAPSDGATVSGSFILAAAATDDVAVANVQFIINGKSIGSAFTSPPYATLWDSATVTDGSYTLYAVARDTSGNYMTSAVNVTVKNK